MRWRTLTLSLRSFRLNHEHIGLDFSFLFLPKPFPNSDIDSSLSDESPPPLFEIKRVLLASSADFSSIVLSSSAIIISSAFSIHWRYPSSSRSSCCCFLNFRKVRLFSTRSLSFANSPDRTPKTWKVDVVKWTIESGRSNLLIQRRRSVMDDPKLTIQSERSKVDDQKWTIQLIGLKWIIIYENLGIAKVESLSRDNWNWTV